MVKYTQIRVTCSPYGLIWSGYIQDWYVIHIVIWSYMLYRGQGIQGYHFYNTVYQHEFAHNFEFPQ
jgi:hypothetical protein